MESERILPELPTESLESCGSQNQGGGSSTSNQREHDKLPGEQWDWDGSCKNSQRNRRNHAVRKIRAAGVQHQINTNTINSHNRFRRHTRSDGRVVGNRRSAMLRVVTAERLQGVRRQPDCARRLPVWSQIRGLQSDAMRRVQSSAAGYDRMSGNGRIREERPSAARCNRNGWRREIATN